MDNALVWLIGFTTLAGFNFSFWLLVSLFRYIVEGMQEKPEIERGVSGYRPEDVAAVIPAHNEEKTIKRTISALLRVLPRKNIYVASDFSTDGTVAILREMGIRSLDIRPNMGKARSMVLLMREYGLLQSYRFILINDADTEIEEHYLERALPLFHDLSVAAVATHGVTRMQRYNFWQKYFIAYRLRLWRIIQVGMRFGQTWKFTNVTFIIPGSLALYRSRVIEKLEVDAEGLLIEDFNMTFEVRRKKLGKIAYQPNIIGIHQDPYTLSDYIKQIRRWNVGFFQTVKRHGIWPSMFWLATTAYYIELYLYAIFMVSTPILFIFFLLNRLQPLHIPFLYDRLTIFDLFVGLFVIDYVLTVIAAFFERNVSMLFYGLGFIFLRYIDSVVYLISPWIAFTKNFSGTWKSPKRL